MTYNKVDKKKPKQRKFHINKSERNTAKNKFCSNFLVTSNYTWYNFLPKALLIQFLRVANVYFLIITIIQCVPQLSPLSPLSAVVPFVFVLSVSIVREGFEDYAKHVSDENENMEKVKKFEGNQLVEIFAKDLAVGDVIFIEEYSIIPADAILLSCSNSSKIAYIETANLDGEKNLKPKFCIPQIYNRTLDCDKTLRLRGKVKCALPNSDIYGFNGSIDLGGRNTYDLSVEQLIYKGTIIKNTKWATAVVVYTGKETKIILNSSSGKTKQSHIEKNINKIIGGIVVFQVLMCLLCALFGFIWSKSNEDVHVYLSLEEFNIGLISFYSFFTYLLLYNTLIPLSLVVSIEVVKYTQCFFMEKDVEMYCFEKQKFPRCNTKTLNEELGQIKYIFSDKTGTLTANKLQLKAVVVSGQLHGMTKDQLEGISKENEITDKFGGLGHEYHYGFKDQDISSMVKVDFQEGDVSRINEHSVFNACQEDTKQAMFHFLYCLSLNHTCFVHEKKSDNRKMTKKQLTDKIKRIKTKVAITEEETEIEYKGESPDEIVLVDSAARMGFKYVGGDQTVANLRIGTKDVSFDILEVLKYSSARGMMSVVSRRGDKIVLYSKGANSKLKAKMGKEQFCLEGTQEKSELLALKGLRVLWIGFKELKISDFTAWQEKLKKNLNNASTDEEKVKTRRDAWDELEQGLTILGCTAVEDKLQDEVPKSISEIQKAGINFWILTGDTLPTAKNIGIMCKLLPPDMELYELNDNLEKLKQSAGEANFTEEVLSQARSEIEQFENAFPKEKTKEDEMDDKATVLVALKVMTDKYKKSQESNPEKLRGVVVETSILRKILPDDSNTNIKLYGHPLSKLFLDLSLNSQAVVCCRVVPKQKALVVRMVKSNIQGAITLSIGDGANDVPMLKEADVGVGIYGEEGTQAAMASDFAIGEFKNMKRLVLNHGRLNYIRIADMIQYFFLKNFILTVPQMFFAFYTVCSGETWFNEWYVSLYNMLFTCNPLLIRAMFDTDFRETDSDFVKRNFPLTYYVGRENLKFGLSPFLFTILKSLFYSVLIYFAINFCMHNYTMDDAGNLSDFINLSVTQFTVLVIAAQLLVLVPQYSTTFLDMFFVIFSIIPLYAGYVWYSNESQDFNTYKTVTTLLGYPHFYLVSILVLGVFYAVTKAEVFYEWVMVPSIWNLVLRGGAVFS